MREKPTMLLTTIAMTRRRFLTLVSAATLLAWGPVKAATAASVGGGEALLTDDDGSLLLDGADNLMDGY